MLINIYSSKCPCVNEANCAILNGWMLTVCSEWYYIVLRSFGMKHLVKETRSHLLQNDIFFEIMKFWIRYVFMHERSESYSDFIFQALVKLKKIKKNTYFWLLKNGLDLLHFAHFCFFGPNFDRKSQCMQKTKNKFDFLFFLDGYHCNKQELFVRQHARLSAFLLRIWLWSVW